MKYIFRLFFCNNNILPELNQLHSTCLFWVTYLEQRNGQCTGIPRKHLKRHACISS